MFRMRREIRQIKRLGEASCAEINKIAKAEVKAQRMKALAESRPPTRLGRIGKTGGDLLTIFEVVAGIAAATNSVVAVYRDLKSKTEPPTEREPNPA